MHVIKHTSWLWLSHSVRHFTSKGHGFVYTFKDRQMDMLLLFFLYMVGYTGLPVFTGNKAKSNTECHSDDNSLFIRSNEGTGDLILLNIQIM